MVKPPSRRHEVQKMIDFFSNSGKPEIFFAQFVDHLQANFVFPASTLRHQKYDI